MALRLGPIVGLAGLALVLARMRQLISPAVQGLPWPLVLVAAVALGMLVIWGARLLRLPAPVTVLISLYVTFAMVTLVTGLTSVAGLPTAEGRDVLRLAFAEGFEQFTLGTAPVIPTTGLMLLLMMTFIWLGFAAGWSTTHQQMLPLYAVLGIIYAVISVVDKGASRYWLVLSVVWVAAALVALSADDRFGGPRVLGTMSRTVPVVLALGLVAVSLIGVNLSRRVSSPVGLLETAAGDVGRISGVSTGISYNLFASSIQTDLVSRSEEVVFEARISSSPIPSSSLYWRMITLDEYDGVNWFPRAEPLTSVQGEWENPDNAFALETATVQQVIRIQAFRNNFLPTLYAPNALVSKSERISNGIEIRSDGSIRSRSVPFDGTEYQARSMIPVATAASLDRAGSEDQLLLNAAVSQGLLERGALSQVTDDRLPALDRLRYLNLPPSMSEGVVSLARSITEATDAPLEEALLLENYFRDGDRFEYTLDIDPGHASTELSAWLLDADSDNYRAGYCEQFATAMASTARSVGLPSRVVLGFTPGEQLADGTIIVRGKNAHAWVDIWLNGVGWMQFDPTPRGDGVNPATSDALGFDLATFAVTQREEVLDPGEGQSGVIPQGDRVEKDEPTPGEITPLPESGTGFSVPVPSWAWKALSWIGLILALPLAKMWRRKRRLKRAKAGDISRAWEEIVGQLQDTGIQIHPSLTVDEVVDKSVDSLQPLAYAHTVASFSESGASETVIAEGLESFGAAEVEIQKDQTTLDRLRMAYSTRSLRFRKG